MPVSKRNLAIGALAVAVLGGIALYGTRVNFAKLGATGPCAGSADTVTRIAPLARGEVAALGTSDGPRPPPSLRFKDPDGADLDLASFRGKALLVNLWATWCGPCKAEMPALDRLQADLGGDAFEVVAINVETRNAEKVPTWLQENWIDHLAAYTDPSGRTLPTVQQQTGTAGLPTTLLIDKAGCEVGVMKGPAQWDSEDAKQVIRTLIGGAL